MCEWINFHRCRQFRVHSIDFLRLASRFLWDFPPTFFHKLLPSFSWLHIWAFSPSTAATMAAAGNFYLFDIGGLCSIFFTPFHRKWWWLDSWLSSPDLLLTPQIARITLRGLTHEISGKICCLCVAENVKNSGRLLWILPRWEWGKHWAKKKCCELKWPKKVHWHHHILALRRKFTFILISVTYILWKDTETTSSLRNEISTLPENEPLFPPRCMAECCCHREWLPRASESSVVIFTNGISHRNVQDPAVAPIPRDFTWLSLGTVWRIQNWNQFVLLFYLR